MLIVLGGLIGDGRWVLSRKLASQYKFHLYDINNKRMHRHVLEKSGEVRETIESPRTDEMRLLLYERVLEDFGKISKMYPDTIVQDWFHRIRPRSTFLRDAANYFDSVVFVWIESEERYLLPRLQHMVEKGAIKNIEAAVRQREKAIGSLQRPDGPTPIFNCTTASHTEVEALWNLIQSASQR